MDDASVRKCHRKAVAKIFAVKSIISTESET